MNHTDDELFDLAKGRIARARHYNEQGNAALAEREIERATWWLGLMKGRLRPQEAA